MFRVFFKSAIRNFVNHKLFTVINVIGLSVGISAGLAIFAIVFHDFTFDKFHSDGDRIYRVVTSYVVNGNLAYTSAAPGALPEAAPKIINGIEKAAPFETIAHLDVVVDDRMGSVKRYKEQDDILFADERYFNLFEYRWIAGNVENALTGINQVVLTVARAKLYFPNLSPVDVIGKTIVYDRHYDKQTAVVTGIVELPAGNTDLTFHDFISYNTLKSNVNLKHKFADWYPNTNLPWDQYFVKIAASANPYSIEKSLNSLLLEHVAKDQQFKNSSYQFHLEPFNELHFDSRYGTFYGRPTSNKSVDYGLILIAIMLLSLGCINFISLTTAQANQRAKEIGIRKVLGSSKKQLTIQFLFETFLITIIAVLISVATAPILLNIFSVFIAQGITIDYSDPYLIVFLILLTLTVTVLAGYYPARILSGYRTLSVIKNQIGHNNAQNRSIVLRKGLTVTQFIVAQFFVMCTFFVGKQIYYALNKNLGYKKDAILIVETPWQNQSMQVQYFFREKLKQISQIGQVSMGLDAPASENNNITKASYNTGGHETNVDVLIKSGDENYTKIYDLKILSGRNLTIADTTGGVLINTKLAHELGFKNYANAIGKEINVEGGRNSIIGVIADFYQSSLHVPIKPLIISTRGGQYSNRIFHIALKSQSGKNDWNKAIVGIQTAWKQAYPEYDFEYRFFDDSISHFYESEHKIIKLLNWATGLSIFISCLGLLGLTIYTTDQRRKEISIRKVMGATTIQLMVMLSKQQLILILIAFFIAAPFAWMAMNKWIQSFNDRTAISWWIFAISGGCVLIIGLIVSGYQTLRAAMVTPSINLRVE